MKKFISILSIPIVFLLCSLILDPTFYLTNHTLIQSVLFLSGLAALGISRQHKNVALIASILILMILESLFSNAVFQYRYDAQFTEFETTTGQIIEIENKVLTLGSKYWIHYTYDALGNTYQSSQPISENIYYQTHFNCPIEIDFLRSSPEISRVSSNWDPEEIEIIDCYTHHVLTRTSSEVSNN